MACLLAPPARLGAKRTSPRVLCEPRILGVELERELESLAYL